MEKKTICSEHNATLVKNKLSTLSRTLLPLLILLTPFLVFLDHNAVHLDGPEILLIFAGMSIIALLFSIMMLAGGRVLNALFISGLFTLFIDAQFDWLDGISKYALFALILGLFVIAYSLKENIHFIALAVFAAMFVVTLGQSLLSDANHSFAGKMAANDGNSLPRFIHFILDEHIGIEGIPTDIAAGIAMKERLIRFYRGHGFRVFGNAFSQYVNTHDSISNTLNFSTENKSMSLVSGEEPFEFELLRNRYFEFLSARGYHLNVLGPGFMAFCSAGVDSDDNCFEYPSYSLSAVKNLAIPISSKVQLLLNRYSEQSDLFRRTHGVYQTIQPRLVSWGIPLPPWNWERGTDRNRIRMHSLVTLQALDALWEDILSMPAGNVMFAHLLLPHAPYVCKADCSVRLPIQEWKDRSLPYPGGNTAASREERYRLYFQQLQCLYVKLDNLFENMRAAGIYDNAIIILHGDHGSKIVTNEPFAENRNKLSRQDFIDGFSTLFAVKLPGVPADYNTSPRPLVQLLAELLPELGITAETSARRKPEHFVYLRSHEPQITNLVRTPYPVTQ